MTPLLTTFVTRAATRVKTRDDLDVLKREIARETGTAMPQNSSILAEYVQLVERGAMPKNAALEKVLRIRSIRSMSGIVPIGVHTKPMGCPGRCVFCPTEVRMPKSYLSKQPAVMRAIANEFDPYKMVSNRLLQLERNGHNTEKCELIVMGGTWSAHPRPYQEEFIRRCFDGFNGCDAADLEEAKHMNETAKHRVVGITLETRPDWVDEEEVVRWRRYGATRTEIGVQHTDNRVLELVKRGHGIEASMHATQLFKDAGFKITYHMMPGLPGSTPEMDLAMHREIFARPELKPDQIKIYPCLVNEHAELYQWFKDGRFVPYDDATLDELLIRIKTTVPEYCRIARLFRDFPKEVIQGGSQITNFRQKVQQEMNARGLKCVCLRCREARGRTVDVQNAELVVREYDASGGKEIFLSFESPDRSVLYAFLRLRFHSYA
ncbi:MAG: tRNA uridine(34) 5-carboxymethylaminomethyl modification radical SAM/GNAT enzyme Elp3, partial [Candidatus Kerfeldbacteria bacterium]|nr:tRNA uridine(34) 5-carboxymethylaminomethyl modification radical SAM/GNAT enzyme Elp3 [Candidatus Kerfeldbacteria bacterium]